MPACASAVARGHALRLKAHGSYACSGDQRKRIEELNEGRDKPKRKRKKDNPLVHESPHTLKFGRCFWHDLPAPAPTWREQITGPEREPSLKAIRKGLSIVVKGDCPPPIAAATDPHLPPSFAQFFTALHFTEPSRVQRQCWPAALTGADVLGIAPTGSGKTLAFLLPSVPHIQAQIHTHGPLRAAEGPLTLEPPDFPTRFSPAKITRHLS